MVWFSGALMTQVEVFEDSDSDVLNWAQLKLKLHVVENTSTKEDVSILDNCENKCNLNHCILLLKWKIVERVESNCFLISWVSF